MRPGARGRATMRDVAREAGVSLKTVSRVVNAEPDVSARMRERVNDAAAHLGYRHNLTASNLRRGTRTASFGVLLQDVSNDFCAALLRAVELRARERGVVVVAASIDEDLDRERELVDNLLSRRIDGLVLMPTGADQGYLTREHEDGLAVVLVDRRPASTPFDTVTVDNHGASRRAVRHLLDHGHRRVGLVCDDPAILTAQARRAGYRAALLEAGLPVDHTLERSARNRQEACSATIGLLDLADPPTAIFAPRNVNVEGVLEALMQRGLIGRIALVGFDDPSMGDLLDPGLTAVRQDVARIGVTATDLLLARLDGAGDQGPPRHEVIPTDLVERGTGEILPS